MRDREPQSERDRARESVGRVIGALESFSLPRRDDPKKSAKIFIRIEEPERFSEPDMGGYDLICGVNPEANVPGNPEMIGVQVKSSAKAVEEFIKKGGGKKGMVERFLIVLDGSPENYDLETDVLVELNRLINTIKRQHRRTPTWLRPRKD